MRQRRLSRRLERHTAGGAPVPGGLFGPHCPESVHFPLAKKRFDGMETLLSELDDCVPGGEDVSGAVERMALAEVISRWLESLPREDRSLFIRRYWYGEAVRDLAAERGRSPNQTAQRLRRLRLSLRKALEAEGELS